MAQENKKPEYSLTQDTVKELVRTVFHQAVKAAAEVSEECKDLDESEASQEIFANKMMARMDQEVKNIVRTLDLMNAIKSKMEGIAGILGKFGIKSDEKPENPGSIFTNNTDGPVNGC